MTPEAALIQALERTLGDLRKSVAPLRRSTTIPPAPVLDDLPRITKGRHKGERRMTKRQFAGWCQVTVATVSDWAYTKRINVEKNGSSPQARVYIAHGERERMKDRPAVARRRGG